MTIFLCLERGSISVREGECLCVYVLAGSFRLGGFIFPPLAFNEEFVWDTSSLIRANESDIMLRASGKHRDGERYEL